jgi:hypothetical protein
MTAKTHQYSEIRNTTRSWTLNSLPRWAHNWRNFNRENNNRLLKTLDASVRKGIASINPRI